MGIRIAKRAPRSTRIWWRTVLIGAAILLFALGVSRQAYDVTSPGWWSLHVLVRKLYSLGAFAIVGYLFSELNVAEGRRLSVGWSAVIVGAYSALLEGAQFFAGSKEGFVSNVLDVLFGVIGGAVGALAAAGRLLLVRRHWRVERPAESLRDESGA